MVMIGSILLGVCAILGGVSYYFSSKAVIGEIESPCSLQPRKELRSLRKCSRAAQFFGGTGQLRVHFVIRR